MNNVKRKILRKIAVVIGIFALLNLLWFSWRQICYSAFTDGLIIWPKFFGGYEYGVILNDPNDPSGGYMFYITPDGQAVDAEYQEIAAQCQTTIKELLERANEYWEIPNR